MKTKFLSLLGCVVLIALAAGCVRTVAGGRTAAVPFVKDSIQSRYQRPAEELFNAAREVVRANGTVLKESTLSSETNSVRAIEGKVNQRTVWVRVEQIDARVSEVSVQARTRMGGTDIDLAAQLDKEIALRLR